MSNITSIRTATTEHLVSFAMCDDPNKTQKQTALNIFKHCVSKSGFTYFPVNGDHTEKFMKPLGKWRWIVLSLQAFIGWNIISKIQHIIKNYTDITKEYTNKRKETNNHQTKEKITPLSSIVSVPKNTHKPKGIPAFDIVTGKMTNIQFSASHGA